MNQSGRVWLQAYAALRSGICWHNRGRVEANFPLKVDKSDVTRFWMVIQIVAETFYFSAPLGVHSEFGQLLSTGSLQSFSPLPAPGELWKGPDSCRAALRPNHVSVT